MLSIAQAAIGQGRAHSCQATAVAATTLACACVLLAACDRTPAPPRLIEASSITLPGGQSTVMHAVALPADTAVEILVRADGVDVQAERVDATGAVLRADAPNDRVGVITFYEPATAASRRVQVRIVGEDHADTRGTVSVRVQALAADEALQRIRLQAVELEAQACADIVDLAPERGEAAAAAFEQAAELRSRIGDRAETGRNTLQAAGTVFQRVQDWRRSATLAEQAADRLRGTTESVLEVRALRLQGAALQAAAESEVGAARARSYASARARLDAAAELAERRNLPFEAAYAINNRGVGHQYEGRANAARADYERALELFTRAGHAPGRSLSIDSLAMLHHEQGEFRAAVARFDEALALTSARESPSNFAYTLHNSALPLRVLGEFDQAIERYQRAAEILRTTGDREGEARELQGIALALLHAGEPERASALLQEVLRLRQADADTRETFSALTTLADIERDAGRLTSAKALLARARPLAGSARQEGRVLLGQAKVERLLGHEPGTRRLIGELLALELPATHPYRGEAWLELAQTEATQGRVPDAQAAFAAALDVATRNGTELDAAKALVGRAQFQLARGDPASALVDTRHAIDILEAVGEAGTHAQQRAVFLGSRRTVYELQIAAQLALATEAERAGRGMDAEQARFDALATSERSRMGGLLEALRTTEAPPPPGLLQRRREVYELLAGKRQRREALLEQTAPNPVALAELTRAISHLRATLVALDAQMQRDATPQPLGAADVSAEGRRLAGVMPATDLLVEYFIGETRGWAFLVRDGRITVKTLPAVKEIEAAVHESVARWRAPDGGPASARALTRSTALRASITEPLRHLAPATRLWMVADGALHALPMAAMINDGPEDWLRSVEVIAVPSLRTVAQVARRPPARRHDDGVAGKRVLAAVIADPIFTRDDPRLAAITNASGGEAGEAMAANAQRQASTPALAMLTRSSMTPAALPRLPSTATEADGIVGLFPAGSTMLLTGAAATRDSVLRANLSHVRYLHFATHAFADSEDPELSALVLSRYDVDGRALDGTVRLHDVASLRLDADLVVLSGCETAQGRAIRGEGLVGLSYGFLQAGARTVVASLWRVPDTATAKLMSEFYRQVLVEQQTPALALRAAQARIRSMPRWADPYYWAGFQVVTVDPTVRGH